MKTWHVLLGGGLLAGGAFLLGGGDASADSGEPWPHKVDDLRPGQETDMAQDAVCTCYRGGAKELMQLTLCSLKQIWPEHPQHGTIPWDRIVGRAVEGDHPSLQQRIAKIAQYAQAAIATEGRHCRGGDKKPDEPDVDDDEPMPEPEPGETPQQTRKRLFDALLSEKYEGGRFRLIEKNDSGIERAAWWALFNAGVEHPDQLYYKLKMPLMKAMQRGRWNLTNFGGPTNDDYRYISVDGKDVRRAWNPKHEHARAAVLAGRFPKGGGNQYGVIWMPSFDKHEAVENSTFVLLDGGEDPPQELLDLLTG